MQLIVDSKDTPEHIRLAASFLLTLVGDLPLTEASAPEAPAPAAKPPASPIPPPPPVFDASASKPGPLAPPPIPPAPIADATAGVSTGAPAAAAATVAASVTAVTEVERDSAGMPFDARIHQKKKGKKRDGTWKLQKGIDESIVQFVTKELAARLPAAVTGAAPTPPAPPAPPASTIPAPPPPPPGADASVSSTVPLPPVANTVPLPPPNVAPPVSEQVPGANTSVSAPPAPPVGVIPPAPGGVITFRSLVQKITKGTSDGKLTGARVQEICRSCGAPSLQDLNSMTNLIPEVATLIDMELAK